MDGPLPKSCDSCGSPFVRHEPACKALLLETEDERIVREAAEFEADAKYHVSPTPAIDAEKGFCCCSNSLHFAPAMIALGLTLRFAAIMLVVAIGSWVMQEQAQRKTVRAPKVTAAPTWLPTEPGCSGQVLTMHEGRAVWAAPPPPAAVPPPKGPMKLLSELTGRPETWLMVAGCEHNQWRHYGFYGIATGCPTRVMVITEDGAMWVEPSDLAGREHIHQKDGEVIPRWCRDQHAIGWSRPHHHPWDGSLGVTCCAPAPTHDVSASESTGENDVTIYGTGTGWTRGASAGTRSTVLKRGTAPCW